MGSISVLLFASGCAALIYEVVWLQQLQLIIGSSAVSLGLLLATYMGGLFLGSIALPQMISAKYHPLRLYATIEVGIGISGILILFGLPYVGRLYVASIDQGLPSIVLRGFMCAVCLLPPTILMGASFPAVSRWMTPTKSGVSGIGLFYAANIAGAVFGSLFAGFYLLRVYDLEIATYSAVVINAVVALAGFCLAAKTRYRAPADMTADSHFAHARGDAAIYVATGMSGLSAIGAQVVWTRILSVMFGATVYTFSIILAVFLIGLGIGSGMGSFLAGRTERPRLAFGVCQLLLMAAIAWTAWHMAQTLPYLPIDPSLAVSPWFNFQLDLIRVIWTIAPATLLWGASFPLALAALASTGQDPGWLAGGAYAANTCGAIIGAVVVTFISVPFLGTLRSQQMLIGLSSISALVLLAPLGRRAFQAASLRSLAFASLGISTLFALALIGTVSDVPWQVIAYGRRIALMMHSDLSETKTHPIRVLYRGEGLSSSVVITEQWGRRIIYVNGNTEASNGLDDMRLERMAGHLPALVHAEPHDVLVVGFGAGVTAGSFVTHPQVRRIVIAEIESLIPAASGQFFRQENLAVKDDPRTQLIHDDGRHYLLTNQDKFDVITSDPVHLWVKGTSALYSKEYFEIVRRHLNPGGVIAQWLPLYDGDVETIKSVLATFFEVFPNGTVWSNHIEDGGFDLVLLGQSESTKINVDELQQRLNRSDYRTVMASLRAVGFRSAVDVLATYLGRASDIRPWLSGAQINLDRNLRLQYLAGLEINSEASEPIYNVLRTYRRYPEGLFTGSDAVIEPLKALLQTP